MVLLYYRGNLHYRIYYRWELHNRPLIYTSSIVDRTPCTMDHCRVYDVIICIYLYQNNEWLWKLGVFLDIGKLFHQETNTDAFFLCMRIFSFKIHFVTIHSLFSVQRLGAHRDQKLAVDNKTTMLWGQEFYGFNLRIYSSTRYKNHRVAASWPQEFETRSWDLEALKPKNW